MKVSTRGRYALRVMIDLAANGETGEDKYIPLKDVVARQGVSQKYLEGIMTDLSKVGLIEGMHGKGGGYKLVRPAEKYTVGEILRVTEGDLAPISCLQEKAPPCERAAFCPTLPLWQGFYKMINDYFDGVTLADLITPDRNVK